MPESEHSKLDLAGINDCVCFMPEADIGVALAPVGEPMCLRSPTLRVIAREVLHAVLVRYGQKQTSERTIQLVRLVLEADVRMLLASLAKTLLCALRRGPA